MKNVKKFISLFLVVAISICCTTFHANARPYTDTNGHWASTYIDSLTDAGIMESSSTTHFYPDTPFTRQETAKAACMLYKKVNLPSSPHPFTDVPTSSDYSKYIKYMYDNGIVSGTTSTTFSPTASIKRQDLCVILYNMYFTHIGFELTSVFSKVTYSDDSKISSYAKTKVYALQSIGVLADNGGAFRPKENATRAEAATMIYCLRRYAMRLVIPEEVQSRSDWCWAATSRIMAEYRRPGSRTQQEIGSHFNYQNGATVEQAREAANYGTYYNIMHASDTVMTSDELKEEIANFRPVNILIGRYDNSGNWTGGHYLVIVGYRDYFMGTNSVEFLVYDVWSDPSIQRYNWVRYSDLLDGFDSYLNGRKYTKTVYSY